MIGVYEQKRRLEEKKQEEKINNRILLVRALNTKAIFHNEKMTFWNKSPWR